MKSEIFKNTEVTVKDSQAKNLSVFCSGRFFSYAAFDENYTAVLELGSREIQKDDFPGKNATEIAEFLISDFRLGGRKFRNVDVCVLNTDFTLLPESFASRESAKEVIGFSSGLTKITTTAHAVFSDVNFTYTIDHDLLLLFERNFKQAVIRHAGAVSIRLLFSALSLKSCNLFLNFHSGTFELAAKNEHSLLYYNVFSFETNEDILYYLLFMMEQYQLNPVTVKVKIAGQIPANSDLIKTIKKYIKHVEFAVSDKSFSASLAALNLPDHYYFTLLNQHLCGS